MSGAHAALSASIIYLYLPVTTSQLNLVFLFEILYFLPQICFDLDLIKEEGIEPPIEKIDSLFLQLYRRLYREIES